jgi:hypothetical protein
MPQPAKCVKDMTPEEQIARLYKQRNDLYMVIQMLTCGHNEPGHGPKQSDVEKFEAIALLLDMTVEELRWMVLGEDDRHPVHDCESTSAAYADARRIVGNTYVDEGHNFETYDTNNDPDEPGNEWSYARFKWDYNPLRDVAETDEPEE